MTRSRAKVVKPVKETKKQRRERVVTMIAAASRAEGFIMACDFAVLIGRRIVEIGGDLDTATIAQVAVPLGIRPKFVEVPPTNPEVRKKRDEFVREHKPSVVRGPSKKRKGK